MTSRTAFMLLMVGALACCVSSAEETPPAASAPAIDITSGPLRLDLTAIGENRFNFVEPPPGGTAPQAAMRIQFKMRGSDLPSVVRVGNVMINELTDNTGASLLDPNRTVDASATRQIAYDEALIAQGGVTFVETFLPPARKATTLTGKGSVKAFMATGTREITIDNPGQFGGGTINHPELDKLGIKIRVYGAGEQGVGNDNRSLGIRYLEGGERVQSIEFYDDWRRVVPTRTRQMPAEEGQTYTLYRVVSNSQTLGPDCQLVVKCYADIQSRDVAFELKNVELP